jgi:hypothetical protein
VPERIFIVGCTTGAISDQWCPESALALSEPVTSAVERAAGLVAELAAEIAGEFDRIDSSDSAHQGGLPCKKRRKKYIWA